VIKAAQNVSFEVARGKMFTLLGPSGCGKTTTLRSIAGLEKPDSGKILVDGRAVYSSSKNIYIQPNHRNFGMVFQSYAIWPHMTVFENVAFPLQVGATKFSRSQIEQKVLRALNIVALDGYESRRATQLSGGQQQRLALARALVNEPPLLLLDEPLSNLDAKLRERMRFELKKLQEDLGITSIYVTHDQSEALALSHQIAVMSEGQIVQIGSPRDIYGAPANRFVADFVGATNLVSGSVLGPDREDGFYAVDVPFGIIAVASPNKLSKSDKVLISIRPENIRVTNATAAAIAPLSNTFEATVRTQVYLGDRQELELSVGGTLFQARAETTFDISSGAKVNIAFDRRMCTVCKN
jgi:iron(III) transport system ATP-binding protein